MLESKFNKLTLSMCGMTIVALPSVSVVSCSLNKKIENELGNENAFEINEKGYINFYKKEENLKKLIIPNKINGIIVRGIEGWVFNNLDIEEVVFPKTLEFIGEYAFQNNKIKNLILPDSIKEIGKWAFQNAKIEILKLGNNIKTIGEYAFDSNQIKELKIPDSLTKIQAHTFSENQIVNLDLGNGVESLGDWCFQENKIETLIFPKSLKKINFYTFDKNNLIGGLWIPDNVSSIAGYAFTHNPNLKEVSLNKNTRLGLDIYQIFDKTVNVIKR